MTLELDNRHWRAKYSGLSHSRFHVFLKVFLPLLLHRQNLQKRMKDLGIAI